MFEISSSIIKYNLTKSRQQFKHVDPINLLNVNTITLRQEYIYQRIV
jgi:hypothetical protein